MKNEDVFKSKYFEDVSRDLKATLFDVIAEAEKRLEKLEDVVTKDADIDRQAKLNEIWLTINDAVKQIVNASNEMEDSLKHMDLYCYSCDAFLNEERKILNDIDKAVTKNEDDNITEVVDKKDKITEVIEVERQEENVGEETKTPTVENSREVTNEDSKEEVESDSVEEEPQQETNETNEEEQVEEKNEETETSTVENSNELTNEDSKEEVESDSVEEEPQQETNETDEEEQVGENTEETETPTVESSHEVTNEDGKEEVETDSVEEEPQQETNETDEEEQVGEKNEETETPTVESSREVTNEDSKEEVETDSVEEEPQQETNEEEQVEEKIEETTIIPTIVQSVEDVQSENIKVDDTATAEEVIKPVLELPIINEKHETVELQPENGETKPEVVEETPTITVELPVIENSNSVSDSQENVSTELDKEKITIEENANEVVNEDIPAIDENQVGEVDEILEDAQYYIDINGDGNPILINQKQANHLRESLSVQRVLFSERINKTNSDVDETISEQELEDMLNQIPILYEQGKVEEAEAMTEKVSAYSKKIQQAA